MWKKHKIPYLKILDYRYVKFNSIKELGNKLKEGLWISRSNFYKELNRLGRVPRAKYKELVSLLP
jgi:hypothetical protein